MHFQAAALLIEHGMTPQDFDLLAEEFDLLAVEEATLHDPEVASGDPAHLEAILVGAVVWLPGAVPYGSLWRDARVGVPPHSIRLCEKCFPREAA
jgi:hypothetical protein